MDRLDIEYHLLWYDDDVAVVVTVNVDNIHIFSIVYYINT